MKTITRGKVGSKSLLDVVQIQPEVAAAAPVNAAASTVVLTIDTQPTADDTMTIGTTVYTFTTDGTAASAGEIDIGSDLADAKVNIVAAINGTDGINTAHALVSAGTFATNDLTLTAKVKGTSGDAIASTETFTAETNVFSAATLGSGVDGSNGGAWEQRVYGTKLYINVTETADLGVLTDTWYSADLTLVS